MNMEIERLIEGLVALREDSRAIGPHHPKFVEWLAAVRQCLSHQGDRATLDRFETLPATRTANGMWRREELPPGELKEFLTSLDQAEAILRESVAQDPLKGSKLSSRSDREPERRSEADRSPEAARPSRKEPVMNKAADLSGRPAPSPGGGRGKAMEGLLADLGEELKRPEGDLAKIQKMMGDLLDLKKTGDLVDNLLAAAAAPGARWDTVRAPLAQLWATNREIVLDILPALLKKS